MNNNIKVLKKFAVSIGALSLLFLACNSTNQFKNNSEKTKITEVIGIKPDLIREPYLQKVRKDSTFITWKTNGVVKNCYVSIK